MKLLKKIFLFTSCLYAVVICNAQNNKQSEIRDIYTIIESVFYGKTWEQQIDNKDRPSEFFIQIIVIDTSGKVTATHLLADERIKGCAYTILSKMSVRDFEKWKSVDYRGKSVLIPISLLALRDIPPSKTETSFIYDVSYLMAQEGKKVVLLDCLTLSWPKRSH